MDPPGYARDTNRRPSRSVTRKRRKHIPFRAQAHNLAVLDRVLSSVRPDVVFAWNLFFLDASIMNRLEEVPARTVVMLTDNWLLVMRSPQFVARFFRETVHGTVPFEPPGIVQRLRHALAPRSRTKLEAIFGSAFVRDLYAAGGSRFRRSRVVHNGVKQGRAVEASPPRARDSLVAPGTLRLLFAGRLVDLKGAHTAVAALSLLDPAALGVQHIQLTLLGDAEDAAYLQQLEAAIAGSGRAGDIVMRPTVAEDALPSLFDQHDLYLFPSLYEPFSLTLIHALACGIPTIASRTGGNTEIIEDGKSGLLFGKGDPRDLARAILTLAANPALRVRLAVGGRSSAGRFTFERMVEEMTTVLRGGP